MTRFNVEEMQVLSIYKSSTKSETENNIESHLVYIDDPEMLELCKRTLRKLSNMKNHEFDSDKIISEDAI